MGRLKIKRGELPKPYERYVQYRTLQVGDLFYLRPAKFTKRACFIKATATEYWEYDVYSTDLGEAGFIDSQGWAVYKAILKAPDSLVEEILKLRVNSPVYIR